MLTQLLTLTTTQKCPPQAASMSTAGDPTPTFGGWNKARPKIQGIDNISVLNYALVFCSVVDPYRFVTDPDPRIRMYVTGSRYGSRSANSEISMN